MPDGKAYDSPAALLAAVSTRARTEAKSRGVTAERLIREFEFSRLLARVFVGEGSERWVLKGGQAMLVRVTDPRVTKDIDLLHRADRSDLDGAVADLRAALARDLGDFFRFEVASIEEIHENSEQTGVRCRRVTVSVRCGQKQKSPIRIDIAADSSMTDAVTLGTFRAVALPTFEAPLVAVYPVVDHIADKVSATNATYAHGRRSSRERDMVDLVLFALTQHVAGTSMRRAVEVEWRTRGFEGRPGFEPPKDWRKRYPTTARGLTSLGEFRDFDSALELLSEFLDPALAGTVDDHTWNPAALQWEPTRSSSPGGLS